MFGSTGEKMIGIRPLPPFDRPTLEFSPEKKRGYGADLAQLAGAAIEAGEEDAVVRAGVEDVDVLRVRRDVAGLAAARPW